MSHKYLWITWKEIKSMKPVTVWKALWKLPWEDEEEEPQPGARTGLLSKLLERLLFFRTFKWVHNFKESNRCSKGIRGFN